MYGLEILHQCGKRAKTKSQKVLGANSYDCRSYRGKSGRGGLFAPHPFPSWIGLSEINRLSKQINSLLSKGMKLWV